jgi:hypothetical protein
MCWSCQGTMYYKIYTLLGKDLGWTWVWFDSNLINQQQLDPNNLEPWVGLLHSNKFGSCTLKVALS